jgi:hypothetical protein
LAWLSRDPWWLPWHVQHMCHTCAPAPSCHYRRPAPHLASAALASPSATPALGAAAVPGCEPPGASGGATKSSTAAASGGSGSSSRAARRSATSGAWPNPPRRHATGRDTATSSPGVRGSAARSCLLPSAQPINPCKQMREGLRFKACWGTCAARPGTAALAAGPNRGCHVTSARTWGAHESDLRRQQTRRRVPFLVIHPVHGQRWVLKCSAILQYHLGGWGDRTQPAVTRCSSTANSSMGMGHARYGAGRASRPRVGHGTAD